MLARAAILLACAGMLAALAFSLRNHDACDGARRDLFGVVIGGRPASLEAPALRTLRDRCRGTDGLVAASAALQRQGRSADAIAFARRAAREEPRSATAWNALAIAAGGQQPRVAAAAARRAAALSPLDAQPPRR